MDKSLTKNQLFLELAQPNEYGVSRWVAVTEFLGRYKELTFGNGASWCRAGSTLDRQYIIEKDRSVTPGNGIDRIRLAGIRREQSFNQYIRPDIKAYYREKNCVMLGVKGSSVNTRIEIDHKDGRKEDWKVSDPATQQLSDFQPLCKAANDAKRQICKRCKATNLRWKAKNLLGNPFDFYEGTEQYTPTLGCIGCYQYDPVAYRRYVVRTVADMASRKAAETVFELLYPEEGEQ